MFAGTPGKPNCFGQSVSALARQYGGLNNAAAALGYPSVRALQKAILEFCEPDEADEHGKGEHHQSAIRLALYRERSLSGRGREFVDSPLEGGVSCEPVSESRKSALVSPYSGFDVFQITPSNARVRARGGEAADHRLRLGDRWSRPIRVGESSLHTAAFNGRKPTAGVPNMFGFCTFRCTS
jgi:hypothetical protein